MTTTRAPLTAATWPQRHPRALLLGAAVALVACAHGEPAEFRIGLLGTKEGAFGEVSGIPAAEGAQLAVDEINAAGGIEIGGRVHRVVLVDRAVDGRPDAAAAGARGLVNLDSVQAIVGPQISAFAIPAAAVAQEAGIPLIAPMASNPDVTADRPLVFRLAFLDAYQGDVLARFAYDSLGLRRAGVLFDAANPYGEQIARLFAETFTARGGAMVGSETYTTDAASDFRPQLRRLLAARPDALLLPSYAVYDSAQIVQARALGFRGRFLGTDSWDTKLLDHLPESEGAVFVANWDERASREPTQRFLREYQARFGHAARTTAAATYDAIHLITGAAARAGSVNGEAIAQALRGRGIHEGAAATYAFVGTGDPRRGGVIIEVRGGRTVLRAVDEPAR